LLLMATSTTPILTTAAEARFFLAPESTLQRQYEALRSYFVEGLPSGEVARRFGYTPGSFRVLCHQFRHDPQWRAAFFHAPRAGPSADPSHDPVRDLIVSMRKRNMSVYDIQHELAAAGHTRSIDAATTNDLSGFTRKPVPTPMSVC
jgi:hypothetical protein